MKILFKKLATLFIVLNLIVVPLTACTPDNGDGGGNNDGGSKVIENVTFEDTMFAYNGQEQTLEVTGDLPEGVTATYQNNTHKEYGMYNAVCTLSGKGYKTKTLKAVMTIYYDDQGAYDEKTYQYKNQTKFDDTLALTANQKVGKFSDGKTEVLLLTPADINDDSKTKAGLPVFKSSAISSVNYDVAKSDVDVYYKTSSEVETESNIKPPYEGNYGYLVLDSKIDENKDACFGFIPSCTKEQFIEADYLEFYMCLTSPSGTGKETSFTFYAGNSKLYSSLLVNTWVKVRLPLNIYESARIDTMSSFQTSEGIGVKSKKGLYEYLVAGKPFFWTRVSFSGSGKKVYKAYISDLKLKVSTPNEGQNLGSNFAKFSEIQHFPDTDRYALKNVYPRYLDNGLTTDNYLQYGATPSKVVRMDIAINSDNKKSKQTLINQMFVQVNTYKSYNQLKQYDALAVTLYVDSQNPHPLVARLGVPSQTSKTTKNLATFSANKWVTFEIPIEDLLVIYPLLVNTGHYEVPGVGIRSNSIQELFYFTYLANESDWKGSKIYAEELYSTRVEEDDGSVSTKWTDYPSRRTTHAPRIQGTWIQYPYTLYLKSLKLVRHTNA